MACCLNFFKLACQSEEEWARQVVKEAVENYTVIMFVDSNNSTCERLKQLLIGEIGVPNVYVVEIDKMNYKPIEKELERLTGCRIVSQLRLGWLVVVRYCCGVQQCQYCMGSVTLRSCSVVILL